MELKSSLPMDILAVLTLYLNASSVCDAVVKKLLLVMKVAHTIMCSAYNKRNKQLNIYELCYNFYRYFMVYSFYL